MLNNNYLYGKIGDHEQSKSYPVFVGTSNLQEWESQILQDLNFSLWQKNQVIMISQSMAHDYE